MQKATFFLFCFLIFSCGDNKVTISDFSWLQGKWTGVSSDEIIFEKWTIASNGSMDGFSGSISNGDTIYTETVKIEQRGNDIFYVPSVKHNGGPVDFKFTGYKNDSIVFENPLHDFPQRVIYFKLSNNKLYACIDGLSKGKYMRMEFPYEKAE